jgi:hypothetical protein
VHADEDVGGAHQAQLFGEGEGFKVDGLDAHVRVLGFDGGEEGGLVEELALAGAVDEG